MALSYVILILQVACATKQLRPDCKEPGHECVPNHGRCEMGNVRHSCRCIRSKKGLFFRGSPMLLFCGYRCHMINPCYSSWLTDAAPYCKHGGNCKCYDKEHDLSNFPKVYAKCYCREGFTGSRCETINTDVWIGSNPCLSEPCQPIVQECVLKLYNRKGVKMVGYVCRRNYTQLGHQKPLYIQTRFKILPAKGLLVCPAAVQKILLHVPPVGAEVCIGEKQKVTTVVVKTEPEDCYTYVSPSTPAALNQVPECIKQEPKDIKPCVEELQRQLFQNDTINTRYDVCHTREELVKIIQSDHSYCYFPKDQLPSTSKEKLSSCQGGSPKRKRPSDETNGSSISKHRRKEKQEFRASQEVTSGEPLTTTGTDRLQTLAEQQMENILYDDLGLTSVAIKVEVSSSPTKRDTSKSRRKWKLSRDHPPIGLEHFGHIRTHPSNGKLNTSAVYPPMTLRHARQAEKYRYRVDYTIQVLREVIRDRNFTEELAKSLKMNADEFDSTGEFTVDVNSIQAKEVSVTTSSAVSPSDDHNTFWHNIVVFTLMGSAVAIMGLVIVAFVIRRRTVVGFYRERYSTAKSNRPYANKWSKRHQTGR